MPNDEILKKLNAMHDELSAINDDINSAEAVDQDTVEALSLLVKDVQGLMNQTQEKPSDEVTIDSAEPHELKEQILKFETDHPRVSKLLNQISDVLGMMGI